MSAFIRTDQVVELRGLEAQLCFIYGYTSRHEQPRSESDDTAGIASLAAK